MCKLIFTLNWSADQMFKAKLVSSLFRELGGVQFWIASFSLHGIHPVASWALK